MAVFDKLKAASAPLMRIAPKAGIQELYGSAGLIEQSSVDVSHAFDRAGASAMMLGVNSVGASHGVAWDPTLLQAHGLTFGATRSGKGVSAIIPALLTYTGSMVVIDPKGENAWVTAERRRQLGQRVVVLDPWGEVNRRYAGGKVVEQVTRYNPLSAMRPDDPDFADDVTAVADALIINNGGMESHWTDSARELVAGLIAAEVERKPGRASLGQVRRLLTASNEELAEVIKLLHEANPDSLGGRKLRRFANATTEVAGIRSTAETQTALLDNARLQTAMETDEPPFDLAELATGKVTLYLVLPLDRLQSHGRWMRLIITLAIRAIARQANPPALPVMFMLDEMGTIGKLSMVEQAFGLMAGVGIRVWGFLQDLNQLKRDYPDSWETFLANSAVIQVLNARDQTTKNYVSEMLGTSTIERISVATADKRKGSAMLLGMNAKPHHASMSDQVFQRAVMLPKEVELLPGDETLIILPGVGALRQKRVIYHQEPRFKGFYRERP